VDTAQIALVLSSALAVWELARYLLEGGRIRVRLRPGGLEEYGLSEAKTWQSLEKSTEGQGGWPVEVAILDVENLGRTPVTISNPSLDLARRRWQRRKRRSVGPMLLKAPHAVTQQRVRLEPFDSARFVFDIWQVLAPGRLSSTPDRPLRVRGQVRVAGKRWLRRSPWRQGWPVKPGQLWFMSSGEEIGLAAYRAMWRQTHGDLMGRAACVPFALAVRERFPTSGPGPTKDELLTLMDEHHYGEEPHKAMLILASFYAERDLAPFYTGQAPTQPTQG
jgi:hypothetical protein